MRTKVIVEPTESGLFRLRTNSGNTVGDRMISRAPQAGRELPEVTESFTTKLEADRMALRWNMYLIWVDKMKPKTEKRSAPE